MKKTHSLLAHAIHSRLQLIRNKVEVYSRITPDELIELNQRLFESAVKSVEQYHNQQCGRYALFEAAELFIAAFLSDDGAVKNQPMWQPTKQELFVIEVYQSSKDTWYPLSHSMLGGTGNEPKIMKQTEAIRLLQTMSKYSGPGKYRMSEYKL